MHQTTSSQDNSLNDLEIVEFYITEKLPDGSIGTSYYGMNVAKVLEIIRYPDKVVKLPGQRHSAVLGTFNLRNRVLSLVDLEIWLNNHQTLGKDRKVMVVEFSNVEAGFVVSGVTRIYRISWSNVEPAGKQLQSISEDVITGIIRMDEKVIFLLDTEYIMENLHPGLKMEAYVGKLEDSPELGAGCKIMVVDDSSVVRKTVINSLKSAGYDVTSSISGTDAWSKLQEFKENAANNNQDISEYVELIVSDIEMPQMDGHTLTRQIRADNILHDVPVVLFSSLTSESMRAKSIVAGATDQISKPDLPYLAHKVRKLIDEARAKK